MQSLLFLLQKKENSIERKPCKSWQHRFFSLFPMTAEKLFEYQVIHCLFVLNHIKEKAFNSKLNTHTHKKKSYLRLVSLCVKNWPSWLHPLINKLCSLKRKKKTQFNKNSILFILWKQGMHIKTKLSQQKTKRKCSRM